jgi:hypothetical protein
MLLRRIQSMTSKPIAIYYEHPDWFRPLFAELDGRGLNYVKLNASYQTSGFAHPFRSAGNGSTLVRPIPILDGSG